MTKIKIDGISQDTVQFGTKITFVSGKDKYSFFNTKKDGGETKAYEQFKKYQFGVGDTVTAEIKEEPKTFTGKDGKSVNYTQRTIIYFEEVENAPTHQVAKPAFSAVELRKELDEIKARVTKLEEFMLVPAKAVPSISEADLPVEDVLPF